MTDHSSAPPASSRAYGSWIARVGATIIDAVPTAVVFTILTIFFGDNEATTTDSSASFSFQLTGLPFVVYLLFAIGWFVYNWIVRQGSTGQTVGKKVLGITVLSASTQQPIGGGLTFARQLAHILDSIPCLLGYLWPLWDKENRTFADMIMSTRVYQA